MNKAEAPVPEPSIVLAQSRHGLVDLTSTILQDELLVQILDRGQYDAAAIKASLNASVYFLAPKVAPAWQTVANFDTLDEVVVTEAVDRMERLISEKKITDPGEILHTFALKMLMSSEQIVPKNVSQTLTDAKTYIDELLAGGILPPSEQHTRFGTEFDDAAHGFAYWVSDAYAKDFHELRQYLHKARGKALEQKFPDWVTELLQLVKTNGERFYEAMCHTKIGPARFGSVPILAAVAPDAFVDAWMHSPKKGWYWIREALKARYRSPELNAEKAWIDQVRALLRDQAEAANGFSRLRIKRAIPEL